MTVSLDYIAVVAQTAVAGLPEGDPLDALTYALVHLGVVAAVTALDRPAIDDAIALCFDSGASVTQVQETISLVAGLGVHSLMVTAAPLLAQAQARGLAENGPLDAERAALWRAHIGDDPFWIDFEREVPGFLKALLQVSPAMFSGFFDFCAIPWKSGTVPARAKELIAMAADATPTHRFLPGFRIHLHSAIELGAGRAAILRALAIAAAAPVHAGVA